MKFIWNLSANFFKYYFYKISLETLRLIGYNFDLKMKFPWIKKNITIITFYDLWIKSFRVINLNLFLGFPFWLTVRGLFRLGIFAINKDWGLFIAFLRLFINLKAKTFVCLWRGVENWWNNIFKFCRKGLRLSWNGRLDKINRLMKKK